MQGARAMEQQDGLSQACLQPLAGGPDLVKLGALQHQLLRQLLQHPPRRGTDCFSTHRCVLAFFQFSRGTVHPLGEYNRNCPMELAALRSRYAVEITAKLCPRVPDPWVQQLAAPGVAQIATLRKGARGRRLLCQTQCPSTHQPGVRGHRVLRWAALSMLQCPGPRGSRAALRRCRPRPRTSTSFQHWPSRRLNHQLLTCLFRLRNAMFTG